MRISHNGRFSSSISTKLRGEDFVLFIAIAASISVGILLPSFGIIFEPYLLVWLGLLLFLNLIRLDLHDLASTLGKPSTLATMSIVKLVMLPVIMYFIARLVYEPLAVPVLLLSGASTGLGAPFVVNALEKSKTLPLAVGLVIVTSLALPFALPSMVYLLLGGSSEFKIPILKMVFLLSIALFIPIIAGWFTKRQWKPIAEKIDKRSFPISILLISLMNLGVFANFSDFFFKDINFVLINIIAAFILFAGYGVIGYLLGSIKIRKESKGMRVILERNKDLGVVGLITMTYVNNTLVVVFASQFFDINVAALAAFYNLPYYGLILLLKILIK